MTEWISVDDGLPKLSGIYLTATGAKTILLHMFSDDKGWRSLSGKDPEYWNRVTTHWMPLPEPPEMDHKAVAKEIYERTSTIEVGSTRSRERKRQVKEYDIEDRFYINAYIDRLKKAAHQSGVSPSGEFNRGKV
jgi:hypothetical protein